MQQQLVKVSDLKNNTGQIEGLPKNPRFIKDLKYEQLKKSIQDDPEMMELREVIAYDNAGELVTICGNMRLRACKELGIKEVPCKILPTATPVEKLKAYTIKDNVGFGEHSWDDLANEWDAEQLSDWGVDVPKFEVEEDRESLTNPKKLSDRFIIPPFSVLDTKQGAWQQRKNYWLSLGIKSEEGRDSMALNFSGIKDSSVVSGKGLKWSDSTKDMVSKIAGKSDGVSIFDPVLCELAYQWFNVPNGKILDPFAGGSVRGIVAAKLGFQYLGNDLSEKQIIANRNNAVEVLKAAEIYPTWTNGDSLNIDKIAKDYKADMIFSCPPYADLEVYSDAKEDISNMPYKDFIEVYNQIIKKTCDQLKEDRFAVFVVGDVRDKKGFYQNFVSDTIMAFWNCGVILYNEMILLNSVGNAGMRASKTFNGGRKVIKVHQNVLVFYKGNPKNIKANYPELDLSYIQDEQNEE
jgi:DNA modification methylase